VGGQTYPHWEVLVVDDAGPEDGTQAAVQAFAKRHRNHRVLYTRHKKNRGVSAARNTGIALAHGEYVALLDPDDWWKKDHLEQRMRIFTKDPDCGVASGPITNFHEISGVYQSWPFADWQINCLPTSLAANNFLQLSATVVKKQVMKRAGGFTTEKKLQHIEDYDLWIRLARRGVKFGFCEKITCVYRRHPQAASASTEKMARLHQNLMKKHDAFFRNSHRLLLQQLLNKTAHLHALNRSPITQIYIFLYYAIRRLKKAMTG